MIGFNSGCETPRQCGDVDDEERVSLHGREEKTIVQNFEVIRKHIDE